MKQTYHISGMSCRFVCKIRVKALLSAVPGVRKVTISFSNKTATIEMDPFVVTETLQFALRDYPTYQIMDAGYSRDIMRY